MRRIEVTDERTPVIVHYDIALDDAGLDPYAFRIYARIVRRCAGATSGECFESLQLMADSCQMSRASVVRAIKILVRRRMVARKSRIGQTSYYALLDKKYWTEGTREGECGRLTRLPQSQVSREGDVEPGSHRTRTRLSQNQDPALTEPGPGSHRTTKNTHEEHKKDNPEAPPDGLGFVIEELYPGHSTNFRTMRELADLVIKVGGTTSDVRRFPEWLKANHPKKANTPWAFKDLFHESVKAAQVPPPADSQAPEWYRKMWRANDAV